MKKLLFAILLIPNFLTAQKNVKDSIFPEIDGVIIYSEVVYVDSSITKNDLYLNAKN
jgi:hypothetical protein